MVDHQRINTHLPTSATLRQVVHAVCCKRPLLSSSSTALHLNTLPECTPICCCPCAHTSSAGSPAPADLLTAPLILTPPETLNSQVLAALAAGSSVPVPRPLLLCTDASVLGTPFYLMEFIEVRAPGVVAGACAASCCTLCSGSCRAEELAPHLSPPVGPDVWRGAVVCGGVCVLCQYFWQEGLGLGMQWGGGQRP